MKIIVPADHGATEVLHQEESCVVARPRRYADDTYPALWFYFQAINDSGRDLATARIVIEELEPGHNTYFWKHCVWSRDGEQWGRIPVTAQQFGATTLTIETPLKVDEGCWIAMTFPLPYAWYERLCDEMSTPSGVAAITAWRMSRRQIGSSAHGRPLYSFHIERASGAARRNLLIVAGQHTVEQSGKMFAEVAMRGYHSGQFSGTPMERLLQTHNVVVVPLANPDGCYDGRANSNANGVVMDGAGDNSIEMQAVLALIDKLRPHVLINCHGWGNEIGAPPYEDVYRFTDEDALFTALRERVPGCSSSGLPHLFGDYFRLESHARARYATECAITEVNFHWYVPRDGGPPRQPTRADIEARIQEYLNAIAAFCEETQ